MDRLQRLRTIRGRQDGSSGVLQQDIDKGFTDIHVILDKEDGGRAWKTVLLRGTPLFHGSTLCTKIRSRKHPARECVRNRLERWPPGGQRFSSFLSAARAAGASQTSVSPSNPLRWATSRSGSMARVSPRSASFPAARVTTLQSLTVRSAR